MTNPRREARASAGGFLCAADAVKTFLAGVFQRRRFGGFVLLAFTFLQKKTEIFLRRYVFRQHQSKQLFMPEGQRVQTLFLTLNIP